MPRSNHSVDPLSEQRHLQPAGVADLLLAVSSRIADQLSECGRTVHVINHGLAEPFERFAREELKCLDSESADSSLSDTGGQVHVGYAGILCRRPVTREVLQKIVQGYPEVPFHFWGPDESTEGLAVISCESSTLSVWLW